MSIVREQSGSEGTMQQDVRAGVLCLAAAFAGACASHPPEVAPFEGRIGVYKFQERIPAVRGSETMLFEGEFTVLGDTVILKPSNGPCLYDPHSAGSRILAYQCGDVRVTFQRDDPVSKAAYSVLVQVASSTRVCPPSVTTAQAARTRGCSLTDVTDSAVLRTGRLNAKPAS